MNLVLRKGSEKRHSQILGNQTCIFGSENGSCFTKTTEPAYFFLTKCNSIFINQQYFFRIIFWIWPPEPQTMMNSRHFSENTSPVLRKNCYLPGFFPRVSLVGRSSRLSTHTHTHRHGHFTVWQVLSCDFFFVKLPTLYFLNFQVNLRLFQESFFNAPVFLSQKCGRCLLWSTSPGEGDPAAENSIGRSGIRF